MPHALSVASIEQNSPLYILKVSNAFSQPWAAANWQSATLAAGTTRNTKPPVGRAWSVCAKRLSRQYSCLRTEGRFCRRRGLVTTYPRTSRSNDCDNATNVMCPSEDSHARTKKGARGAGKSAASYSTIASTSVAALTCWRLDDRSGVTADDACELACSGRGGGGCVRDLFRHHAACCSGQSRSRNANSCHLFCMLRAVDSRLHSTVVGLCCSTTCAARHPPHFRLC